MSKQELKPPLARTANWRAITDAASSGDFILQVCGNCGTIQYPPRELCKDCLKDGLQWQQVPNKGELISQTVLHASTNAFFRENGPRHIALVKLDSGSILFAHMADVAARPGDRVYLLSKTDLGGSGVFVAVIERIDEQSQLDALQLLFSQNN